MCLQVCKLSVRIFQCVCAFACMSVYRIIAIVKFCTTHNIANFEQQCHIIGNFGRPCMHKIAKNGVEHIPARGRL